MSSINLATEAHHCEWLRSNPPAPDKVEVLYELRDQARILRLMIARTKQQLRDEYGITDFEDDPDWLSGELFSQDLDDVANPTVPHFVSVLRQGISPQTYSDAFNTLISKQKRKDKA